MLSHPSKELKDWLAGLEDFGRLTWNTSHVIEFDDIAAIFNRFHDEGLLSADQITELFQNHPDRLINRRQFEKAAITSQDIIEGPTKALAQLKEFLPDHIARIDREMHEAWVDRLSWFLTQGRHR